MSDTRGFNIEDMVTLLPDIVFTILLYYANMKTKLHLRKRPRKCKLNKISTYTLACEDAMSCKWCLLDCGKRWSFLMLHFISSPDKHAHMSRFMLMHVLHKGGGHGGQNSS